MIPEIQVGIASAKASFDILKAIKGISDATKINAAIIELQQHILSAQQALLDAQETINALSKQKSDLESKLAKHSEWESRRSQYQLTEVRPGLTVYVFQPPAESAMPVHWACPKCFAEEKIQILQKQSPSNRTYKCPECEFQMIPDKELPSAIQSIPRPRRNWML
jgi:predicted RNA-binding Zn-ribbon protein involved in translation (DUF1610 family)